MSPEGTNKRRLKKSIDYNIRGSFKDLRKFSVDKKKNEKEIDNTQITHQVKLPPLSKKDSSKSHVPLNIQVKTQETMNQINEMKVEIEKLKKELESYKK